MRRWLWSVLVAVLGVVVGMWWLQEQEVTRPTLIVPPVKTPSPPQPESPAPEHLPVADAAPTEVADIRPTSSEVSPSHAETQPDPLTEINGIGPAFERALHEVGITTFAQLAQQNADDLAARLNARNLSAERITREEWIEQARSRVGGDV